MIDPVENPPAMNPMLGDEPFDGGLSAPMVNQNPLKAQAAMLAMLNDQHTDALAAYQRLRSRPEDATSSLVAEIQATSSRSLNEMKASLPDLVSDPTIPYTDKEQAINAFRDGTAVAPDSAVALAQKAAAKRSDYFDESGVYDIKKFWADRGNEWQERQAVVNSVVASKDGTMKKVADFAGLFMPLADMNVTRQLQESPIAQELGMGSKAYAMLAPGSFMQEFNKKLNELPYEKKTEALRGLVDIIKNSSSFATSDNNMRALATMGDLNSQEFTNFDKWLMNAGNVLDMLGLPALAKTGVNLAMKAPSTISKIAKGSEGITAAKAMERAGKDIPTGVEVDVVSASYNVGNDGIKVGFSPDDLTKTSSTPQRSVNESRINALEAQRASILSEPTDPLSKGQVTKLSAEREALIKQRDDYRNAVPTDGKKGGTSLSLKKVHQGVIDDLESRISRIDETLSTNRAAENNLQVITDIDKEITALRKADTVEDIPANSITDAFRQHYAQGTLYTHQPRTVSNILMQTNADEARKVHTAMLMDESGEAAIALAGVERNEALIQAVAPQVSVSGRVRWVTPDPERNIRELMLSQDAMSVVNNADGGLRYSMAEIEKGRANIVRDYTDVEGLQLHPAMSSIQATEDGSNVFIQGVYTRGEAGWNLPEDAMAQAKHALRGRGVTEKDITILKREGDEFVPTDYEKIKGQSGECLVGLRTQELVTDGDIGPLDALDVKYNFLDSLQRTGDNKHGSLQTHVIPNANMLHEILTGSMTVGIDRTSVLAEALLEQLDRVTTPMMQLSKERRAALENYFIEANAKQIPLDSQDLIARGFNGNEINIARNWRSFWDTMWDLENRDLARSLISQDYGWFEGQNLQAAVKNQTKRIDYNIKMVYDDAHDVYRPIDDVEMRSIYNNGGYVGELRMPVTINGDRVEHIIVRNTPSEYTRKINATDRILEKRDGYFQVIHKGAQYVEAKYMVNGKEVTEVLKVAGSTKEAKEAVALYQKANPTWTVSHRGDERSISRSSNEYWQLNTQGGRIAQRYRSKLIESTVTAGTSLHIENPAESAMRAIQSISGRTAMRPSLDTAKKRFIDQFGELVAPDSMGLRHYPKSLDQIIRKGDADSKFIRDARTTWNYIQQMENGYVNLLDVGVRAMFRKMANIAGEMNAEGVEKALRTGESANATAKVKSAVFTAYIATIPWRQWLMQGNQSVRAFSYNPVGFLSGSVFEYFKTPINDAFKHQRSIKQEAFAEFMKSTGLYQSISKNNLIRGSMMDASERRGTLGGLIDGPLGTMRKIGFDAGEHFNLWAHGAAVFDEYVRKGKDVKDARVRAEMASTIRAITYDMNYAGDMPYNQNSLSLLMTYMQIPHKAVATAFNRRIPINKRIQMGLGDFALWGVPAGAVKAVYGEGWEKMDDETRRLAFEGVEAWALNKMLSGVTGEDVRADWSSLNPMDMEGWVKMAKAMWSDGGIAPLIQSSANGKLLADGNGRAWMAVKMTADYFKDFREGGAVTADPTDLLDVMNAWASISSGWNGIQQARMKYVLGYARDKRGGITDDHVNKTEAVLAAFGIGTEDTRDYYKLMTSQKGGAKQQLADGAADADMLVRLTLMKNPTASPSDLTKIYLQTMIMHKNMLDPTAANAYWKGATDRLFQPANHKVWETLVKSQGAKTLQDFKEDIHNSHLPTDQKELLLKGKIFQDNAYKAMGYGPK